MQEVGDCNRRRFALHLTRWKASVAFSGSFMIVFQGLRSFFGLALAVSALAGVAACAPSSTGVLTSNGSIDNAFTRKLTWFSFVNGDDLRARCQAVPSEDRLRLVFNGRYRDQVRVYEVSKADGGSLLKEKVFSSLVLNQSFGMNALGEQLTGKDFTVPLSTAQTQGLWTSLETAGLWSPPPVGRRLDSDALWWTAVGCRQGKPFFQAWTQDEKTEAPAFVAPLLALDPSGLAFPSLTPPPLAALESPSDRSSRLHFELEIGHDGVLH